MYRGYRATSVPPSLYDHRARGSFISSPICSYQSIGTPSRLPSYCPPHGQYYGYSSSSVPRSVPVTPPAVRTAKLSCRPPMTLSSTRYFDPVYPSRQFGTRLSKGYGSTLSRPEIYEQVYGISHLPGYGRDSFSAYKIADATIDDTDDLISSSYKRDNEVLRDVERTIAGISICPPVTRPVCSSVRAVSVPPQLLSTPVVSSKVRRSSVHHRSRPKPAVCVSNIEDDMFYKVPLPKVQHQYETVKKGSDLLSAKERMYAREFVDLTSPSATLGLKMRIQNAQNSVEKQGLLLGKYYVGPDKDDLELDAEVRRIKSHSALRAKSVV